MFFGYWKREAAWWRSEFARVVRERDDAKAANRTALVERDAARDELRRTRTELDAANLIVAAEKQHGEALQAKLKTAMAGLDHATHCYEQCEADRQALAKERDAAMRSAFAALTKLNHINGILNPTATEDTPDARPEPADSEPNQAADPGEADAGTQPNGCIGGCGFWITGSHTEECPRRPEWYDPYHGGSPFGLPG